MREFPLPAGPVPSRFSVEIGGVTAVFVTRWNSESQGWYLDVYATDGAPVRLGFRLTVGRPIGWRTLDPRFPGRVGDPFGWLVLIDTTGAGEDPGLFDLGTRHRLIFIEPDDIDRAPAVLRPRLSAAYVPQDGPGSVYVPQIAAHWEALGIPAPTRQYSTQVSSGALTALIGAATLTTSGSGHLYAQSVTGWAYKTIGRDAPDTGTWSRTYSLAASERHAALYYATFPDPASNGTYITPLVAGSSHCYVRILASNVLELVEQAGGTSTSGTGDHRTGIHPILVVARRDLATMTFDAYTDLENISETSGGGPGGVESAKSFALFSPAFGAVGGRFGPVVAEWDDTGVGALLAAGLLDETLLKKLGWSIPY